MKPFNLCRLGVFLLFFANHALATTRYVDLNGENPTSPFVGWSTAATNIQDAIDASVDGDLVLVSNGVYSAGGTVVYGSLTNRVAINKAVTVQSVNGAGVTMIQGNQSLGNSAARCVYLTNNATLIGFTLTNGATRTSGDSIREQSGGGAWCESTNSQLLNCIVISNASWFRGGGIYSGYVSNSAIEFNGQPLASFSASGGGAYASVLDSGCLLVGNFSQTGGGASAATLNNCIVSSNMAQLNMGGGVNGGTLSNCTIAYNLSRLGGGIAQATAIHSLVLSNTASETGGGTYWGSLSGCTISWNSVTNSKPSYYVGGGGSYSSTLFCCAVTNNFSSGQGGGAFYGRLTNCTVRGNTALQGGGLASLIAANCLIVHNSSANSGGGALSSTLYNCDIIENSSATGGGVSSGTVNNCIVFYNSASNGSNYYAGTLNSSCTAPLPSGGTGNISDNPQLVDEGHIDVNSPCRAAGNPLFAAATDIDGEAWLSPPSIGCDEYYQSTATGPLSAKILASYTNVATGVTVDFVTVISGIANSNFWDFGDGTTATNRLAVSHSWDSPGIHSVVVEIYNESFPDGLSATSAIYVLTSPVQYVSVQSTNPVAPYLTWDTAATNIQDAIDTGFVNGMILVTNGTYQFGGRCLSGLMTNRVAVDRLITLRSVNGPDVTVILGYQLPGTTNGDGAIRCVYLTNGASLSGFTLMRGATRTAGDYFREQSAGGLLCESASVSVSNCIICYNSSAYVGGGLRRGQAFGCAIGTNSSAFGGGAYESTLFNCTVDGNLAFGMSGGGAHSSTLYNCMLRGNAAGYGGGTRASTLNDCTLIGNSAYQGGGAYEGNPNSCLFMFNSASQGGGCFYCYADNCTLVSNTATATGGGASSSTLSNCIVYFNNAPSGTNYDSNVSPFYCSTAPAPTNGQANISGNPLFVDPSAGNFRLQSNSPCINSGNNLAANTTADLDGNPRLAAGTVDIGAYELQSPGSVLSYAWAQQYGLPTDGTADYADSDGDGLNNWEEWIAGTNPTNAASVLVVDLPTTNSVGLNISWQSVLGKSYSLECAASLFGHPAFFLVQSNIVGQTGTTTYSDMSATNAGPYFYRVRVQ